MILKASTILFLFFFLSGEIIPQSLSGTLTFNPYPSPYASDWEFNPTALGSLTIQNNLGRALEIRIRAVVTMQGRGEIFRSLTNLINISADPITIISNTTLINLTDASFSDNSYEQKMRQTGRLLEGYYTACLTLENSFGTILATNICSNFTIVYPSAPQLLFPMDKDSIEAQMNFPTFQWMPVIVPPQYEINYTFKLVEVLLGQIPSQAINANIPVYENNQLQLTSFTYPIDALPLLAGKKYAWQVQVLDQYGFPPTQNNGKSEIFTFEKKLEVPKFVYNPITLTAPLNNGAIKTNIPKFTWEFTPPSGVNVKYSIRVVKILSNQNLETAINNYPLLNQTTLTNSYQPNQQLSLNTSDNYAWQVTALNRLTNDTLQKSEIRTFTLFNLILLLPSNNAVINNMQPIFQWAYYGNHKYYDLKVIKLPMFYYSPDGSISEDLFNNPQNIVYQKFNIDGEAISNVKTPGLEIPVFKPEVDIPMEDAKSYYWQVSVKDQPFGTVAGKSEIRKIIFNPYQPGYATNSSITGRLHYEFAKPGEYIMWPLKNINVKLVVKYILKYNSYFTWGGNYLGNTSSQGEFEVPISSLNAIYQFDYNKTIAIGKTDDQGSFSFSFMNLKQMGVINDNFTVSDRAGQEFGYRYTGKLYRVIRLIILSPYYTSPEQDIIIQPGENGSYNSLVGYVRSYSLNVHVKTPSSAGNTQALSANSSLSNMIVYLLRKNRPNEVPNNEGLPISSDSLESPFANSYQLGYRVIAKSVTNLNGDAQFERLVKSVFTQNDEYYIYVLPDTNKTSYLYKTGFAISYKYKYSYDYAVYNYEYKYKYNTATISAYPLNPIVKGKIKRLDGGQPVQSAQVNLLNWALLWWQKETTQAPNPQPTNSNGEFRFDNLQNIYDANGNVTGPIRALKITKYGFRDTSIAVNSGNLLKKGSSWSREIILKPESKVIGKIINEFGDGISSIVKVVGGESVQALPLFLFPFRGFNRVPASFSLLSPKGYVKVIFDPTPFDNSYLIDTVEINIIGSVYDMGTVVIKKANHRIKVYTGIESISSLPLKIPGAKVRLETWLDGILIDEKSSDANGYAEFLFSNSSKLYKLTISAPPDKDFQTKQVILYNTETKNWSYINVYLKPATKISGYVYVGDQKQPVANAKVTIKGSNSGLFPEAYTDNKGLYILHNVPIGRNTFTASKKSSNLIGDETGTLNVPANGLTNVDFNLKIYGDMDITHLLGFPIEVSSLSEKNNDVIISGQFVDLDSLKNNVFSSTSSEMNFSNIAIEPDPNLTSLIFGKTVPISKPKILPLKTEENQLNIKVFENYSGSINENKIGIELLTTQSGYGVIKGKVKVAEGSFNISSQNLSFTQAGFYLKAASMPDMVLPVITADMSPPINTNKFNIVNSSGGKYQYKLFGFDSDADPSKSYLFKDSVVMNSILHTGIDGVTPSDLIINVGDISFTTNKINPLINKTTPINLSLDKWTLQINKWSLNGVLTATSGTLKTGTVDIPLLGLHLKPNSLENCNLDFKSMNLAGITQMKVFGTVMFGYENQGNKKWYLTVVNNNQNYAAKFGGLLGMGQGDSINIASLSLYSDGTKNFSPEFKTLKIYKVGILSLNQLIVGDNSIELGSLSFNIPKIGLFSTQIKYFRENNKTIFKLMQVPINISTNGVTLTFGKDANTQPEILDNNGLRVRGTIAEEGKFSFLAWLYHSKDSTSIWVENPNISTPPNSPPKNWQQLVIGGPATYLDKLTGNMKVVSGNWQDFSFTGNLTVPSGIEQNKNKLRFTVYGDIVANNQELGVKNITSPFGNISFTYQPENKRFFGSLSMEKDLGYSYIKGQAEAIVDNEGWYFFAGGELEVYNPNSKGSAGLLIGNHSITDQMKSTFGNYSYVFKHKGSLPMTFPSTLKGFYLEGMTSIPVQSIIGLPNIDIDLVVVSAKLWVNAGADMRLSMQFDKALTIGAGMDNLLDAGFSVSEWFVVECASLSFGALLDIGSEGQVNTNGDWAAELYGDITLTGKAKVGWGICDSDCEGKLCDEESWTGSKMFGIKGHVGSDGKYINFYTK